MDTAFEDKPHILYVDDIETNLILFEALFKDSFNVSIANSGKKALELMRHQCFSILISDQSMPEMTGTELMEIAKNEFPDIMRFILTAYTDYKTVVDLINKGEIYGFFNKPFETEAIKLALSKAHEVYNLRISNRKMIDELAKANSELLELDRSKTRYLNILTNEIRSPINKIMSAVHMLKDRIGSNDLADLLFYLDTSVSRLESFSFAANQLARLNVENSSTSACKDVNVRELIELCILENNNMLGKFQTSVVLPDENPGLQIHGEYELLMTCLTTLLMNSIKYVEKNTVIKIQSGSTPLASFIEIVHPGTLYTKNQIDNLTGFFSDNKSSDFTPGIEMVLARQIMVFHHGKISINFMDDNTLSTKMVFPIKL